MTFGFSRDDAAKFLGAYYDKKIYENDPFAKLDQVGVGKLVKWPPSWAVPPAPTCIWASAAKHGGDPSSVEFCHRVGLDYVSCSPSVCLSPVWPPLRQPIRNSANKKLTQTA